ncbi:MAG TPA: HEAT repeat domain-containing protein [Polyangia bacterium]|nr:HEAT repeat domain-containing protein [Polyangia bacterium]
MNMNANKLAIVTALGLALGAAGSAQAGTGGSYQTIQSAIAANSVDSIKAELERTEFLVCAACVDLVTPLIDHPDFRVRTVAAWWLARRAVSKQVQVQMLTRLSQPDSTAALDAADVLGELHYVSSIPALGAALSNPTFSAAARAEMARALGTIGRPAGTQYLTAALADSDPAVRSASLVALRGISGNRDGSVAAPLVSDSDPGVRADAVVTIGMFKYAGGAAALVTALGDPSPTVRKKAAWALGEVGAPSSVAGGPLQNAAASDPSPLVRSLAKAALTKLK